MIFIFGWVALSVLVGVIATLRGRHGLGWIMLSILVSPLIALAGSHRPIFLVLMPASSCRRPAYRLEQCARGEIFMRKKWIGF